MKKETVSDRQTLSSWCKRLDDAHRLGMGSSLMTLVVIKCLSLFSLVFAFYFFAHIAQSWVVLKQPASHELIIGKPSANTIAPVIAPRNILDPDGDLEPVS